MQAHIQSPITHTYGIQAHMDALQTDIQRRALSLCDKSLASSFVSHYCDYRGSLRNSEPLTHTRKLCAHTPRVGRMEKKSEKEIRFNQTEAVETNSKLDLKTVVGLPNNK